MSVCGHCQWCGGGLAGPAGVPLWKCGTTGITSVSLQGPGQGQGACVGKGPGLSASIGRDQVSPVRPRASLGSTRHRLWRKRGVLFRQPQLAAQGSNARPRTGRVPKFPSLPKSVMGEYDRKGSRPAQCWQADWLAWSVVTESADGLFLSQTRRRILSRGSKARQGASSKQASLWPAVRRMSQRREAPSCSAPGSISSPNKRPGQCQWLAAEGTAPGSYSLWCSSGAPLGHLVTGCLYAGRGEMPPCGCAGRPVFGQMDGCASVNLA
jgi:hypothetical protein